MDIDSLETLAQEQLNSTLSEMMPLLVGSLISSLALLLIIAIFSARSHRQQKRAILQTAEDTHAIRELLEKRFGNPAYTTASRPEALKNDPQLPPQP